MEQERRIAARASAWSAALALLAAGAAIDRKTNFGETALFMAAANGHADVVKALLAAGANANDTRGDGSSALSLASERRHIATVQVLLAAGATGN